MSVIDKIKVFRRYIMYGYRATSEMYIDHLRSGGAIIGEGTKLYSPSTTEIDETRPWMIEIGKNVQITRNVTILTHGYEWSVLKGVYGDVLGSCGKVKVGDNVFIGVNTTILKGVTVGENVIIGANSLVTKDIPANSVVAGVPAKVVCTVDEYYNKRKGAQQEDAEELLMTYYERFNKIPPKHIFREFFFLFENRKDELPIEYEKVLQLVGNYEDSLKKYEMSNPMYESYEKFIEDVLKEFKKDK